MILFCSQDRRPTDRSHPVLGDIPARADTASIPRRSFSKDWSPFRPHADTFLSAVSNAHDEAAHVGDIVRDVKNMFACADDEVGCEKKVFARARNVFGRANIRTANYV